jgi:hypothetical protein
MIEQLRADIVAKVGNKVSEDAVTKRLGEQLNLPGATPGRAWVERRQETAATGGMRAEGYCNDDLEAIGAVSRELE